MYGYIYRIKNNITNKIYIGKHKYNKPILDKSYRTSGTYIKLSINKYGWHNFTQDIVDTADSLEELNNKEIYYIQLYNCRYPLGYNLTSGGDGLSEPSLAIREKMSLKKRGIKQSLSARLKKSIALRRVVHTPEWVSKISASNRGRTPCQSTILGSIRAHKYSKWYNNGQLEIMLPLDKPVPEGFIPGRLKNPFPDIRGSKHSPERIAKISASKSGTMWCNNGNKEVMLPKDAPLPPGYIKGRIKTNK